MAKLLRPGQDLAKKKYQAGLVPEVEALQMEVDLADSKIRLLSAQGVLGRSENAFKQLIGLELSDSVGECKQILSIKK